MKIVVIGGTGLIGSSDEAAADQLVEEAETWNADCVFVGAKGTRGIERLLLGSVSSAVAARAHCSVEVVRRS